MEDYYAPLARRPNLDFTELEAVRRAHNSVTDAELAYAVGWEAGALPPGFKRKMEGKRLTYDQLTAPNGLSSGARGG